MKFDYPRLDILADFETVVSFLPIAPTDIGIVTVGDKLTIQGNNKTSAITRYTNLPIKGNIAFGVSVKAVRNLVEHLKSIISDTVEVELNNKGFWVAGERLVNLWEKTVIVSKLLEGARLVAHFETNAATLRGHLKAAAAVQQASQGWGLTITHYGASLSQPTTNRGFGHHCVIEAIGDVVGVGQAYDIHWAGEALRLIPNQETVKLLIYQPVRHPSYLLATQTQDTVRYMSIRPTYLPSTL